MIPRVGPVTGNHHRSTFKVFRINIWEWREIRSYNPTYSGPHTIQKPPVRPQTWLWWRAPKRSQSLHILPATKYTKLYFAKNKLHELRTTSIGKVNFPESFCRILRKSRQIGTNIQMSKLCKTFSGGADSNVRVIYTALLELVNNPEAQEKMADEIHTVIGKWAWWTPWAREFSEILWIYWIVQWEILNNFLHFSMIFSFFSKNEKMAKTIYRAVSMDLVEI